MTLRTLMFGWEYPPLHLGGLGVACQGLVRGLAKHGVHVTLVLPHPNPTTENGVDILAPDNELERRFVRSMLSPYEGAAAYRQRYHYLPPEDRALYGDDLGAEIERYTAMSVDLTQDAHPDVVHCHDWMTFDAGYRAAKFHNKPLVAHVHATELDRTDFKPNQWIADHERNGLLRADRIIAVSGYTKNLLVRHYGIPADRIVVIHNGATIQDQQIGRLTSEFRRNRSHPLVLFLGRLTVQKGAHQFLAMAKDVHAQRPEVQFVVAGDGYLLPELIENACQLGLQDCVVFAGKVTNREAQELFKNASCFVMPSVSEPFGLVALEAASYGTPVILSRQSGVSEVLPHAFTVDFWDTAKMADCVLTVLREEPLARQLHSEAPRVLQQLTWERQANIVAHLYDQLSNG